MLFIYRSLISLIFPIIIVITVIRIIFKKEDKFRYREKLFSSSFNVHRNKDKRLIWFHVASIGELKSIVPLIDKLNETGKFEFLITTVSLSSSKLVPNLFINQRNVFHRFFPYDKLRLVKSFLDKWKPDMILFVDSEIWPNFLFEINSRKIPLIMLNGRITKKTFNRWKMVFNFAKNNFNKFNLCLAASKESENYLKLLGAKNLKFFGNIKLADEINPKKIFNLNSNFLLQKKFWCAASTHKGEEIICIKTHLNLKKIFKNIITIIIPRHIERCNEIKFICDQYNINSQVLNKDETIQSEIDIVIVNSFGVLNEYFKFCKSAFIGKSLLKRLKKVGGQNPIEAAKLGCKIYHGPYVSNFKDIYDLFKTYDISEEVKDDEDLFNKLKADFENSKLKKDVKKNSLNELGREILDNSLKEIIRFL